MHLETPVTIVYSCSLLVHICCSSGGLHIMFTVHSLENRRQYVQIEVFHKILSFCTFQDIYSTILIVSSTLVNPIITCGVATQCQNNIVFTHLAHNDTMALIMSSEISNGHRVIIEVCKRTAFLLVAEDRIQKMSHLLSHWTIR